MSPEEIEEYKKEREKELSSGFSRWDWFAIIEKLAKGDVTKFEEVYKVNIYVALNLLSYWKERDIELEKIRKAKEKTLK
jgi:hypothetical protein